MPRDPHAHYVVAPGPRLFSALPLEVVREAVRSRGRRSVVFTLNLTSLVDVLLVTVVFLLAIARAPDGCFCIPSRVRLPRSESSVDVISAPMVSVDARDVRVDGVLVATTDEAGTGAALDGMFRLLRARRELWRQLEPDRTFSGNVLLQIDEDVPAVVVKRVVQTATVAGFSELSFLVRNRR